jgi:2-C-methyl-D-erythritol 4-phosphate cytidylyltransferase
MGVEISMASAIIVAAGKGLRMRDPQRKQYLRLGGRPIISHTLLTFDGCDLIQKIVLVVPAEDMDYCRKKIIGPLNLRNQIHLVAGGQERQDSVYNALESLTEKETPVVIHDGVRPFVTAEHIKRCLEAAIDTGACILAMPLLDTVKQEDGHGRVAKTLERTSLWRAQTPQVFDYSIIHQAHLIARQEGFQATDDSLLVERLGYKVKILTGNSSNIKITTQEDLAVGEAILQSRTERSRQ